MKMATTELTRSRPAGLGERLLLTVEAGLARLTALWRAAQNRRSVARLLEWDDHMLRDVGLTQGDVRSALASGFTDDPSYRLGAMSVERRRAVQAAAKERLEHQGYFLRTLTKQAALRPSSGARNRLSA
jgi:uncharacterized protein YjiS (DUF1127 family)